ncbi:MULTISPECIES: MFS transporter [unclassified Francisella]|uniref:MFS transporter n=1 Tax=unclassified Francisella TaxID=2610885 RepID=UPI002E35F46F|nr:MULTISPECIES: MFS transporter [unclassified Francisella]MED7818665.1 MFS transporter [Francisella sp. 19S2-4]MED7829501.1 MFS transporter [Francisella sp. 19S2-10]
MGKEEKSEEASFKSKIKKKSVQQYLDEEPVWPDGTKVNLIPLSSMQWFIWLLATAGKFFEGMIVFMTGIALHLIAYDFQLSNMQKGMIGSATLVGILIGASLLGSLSDKYGRKNMFIIEMIIFLICIIGVCLSSSFVVLFIMLLIAGIALGCDYPTAHLMISETIPSRNRGKLVLGAFAFQAVGALVGTLIGWLVLVQMPSVNAWKIMYSIAIIPAIFVVIGRFFIPKSPHFLVTKGEYKKAERALTFLLNRRPRYPKVIRIKKKDPNAVTEIERGGSYKSLFTKYRKQTIFASLPWFIQDLGTYGIGVFLPLILTVTIGSKVDVKTVNDVINNEILATKGSAFIDVFFFLGIVFAIFLSDYLGRVKLQIFGFIGCAVGLAIAMAGHMTDNNIILIFLGFIIFQFMTNIGPNAQTYVIAGEVFPTHARGKGAGFAASFAKVGAIIAAFLFPILISVIGVDMLLVILIITSILGAVVTKKFGIETKGVNLETI